MGSVKEILEAFARKRVKVNLIHCNPFSHLASTDWKWTILVEYRSADGAEVKVTKSSVDLETAVVAATEAFESVINGGLATALLNPPKHEERKSDDDDIPF